MKILIVEDEPKTGDYLKQGLTEAGFVTDLARDGWEGLELAQIDHYDLLILDVMLPGLNGWQVLEGIRRAGIEMPVLFLTARDQVEDRVKGLELGADDYLVKPWYDGDIPAWNPPSSRRPTWNWIYCDGAPYGQATRSNSRPRSLPCWNCSCGGRGRCCRAA